MDIKAVKPFYYTENPLISSLFGGIHIGAGLARIHARFSTGGTI
jgi:uncharacterized membrane-anchored protein YitT (DUF2179 family)